MSTIIGSASKDLLAKLGKREPPAGAEEAVRKRVGKLSPAQLAAVDASALAEVDQTLRPYVAAEVVVARVSAQFGLAVGKSFADVVSLHPQEAEEAALRLKDSRPIRPQDHVDVTQLRSVGSKRFGNPRGGPSSYLGDAYSLTPKDDAFIGVRGSELKLVTEAPDGYRFQVFDRSRIDARILREIVARADRMDALPPKLRTLRNIIGSELMGRELRGEPPTKPAPRPSATERAERAAVRTELRALDLRVGWVDDLRHDGPKHADPERRSVHRRRPADRGSALRKAVIAAGAVIG